MPSSLGMGRKMRRLLFLGVVLLCSGIFVCSRAQVGTVGGPSWGLEAGGSGWVLKAFTVKAGAGGTSTTTSAINTTGSDLIAVCTTAQENTITFSDSASNTWNKIENSNGDTPIGTLYWVHAPTTSASHTFTASSASFAAIAVLAFSGSAASPLDQSANAAHTSTGTSLALGSITPGVNNEMIVSCLSIGTAAGSTSINSGTLKNFSDFSSGNSYGVGQAYFNQATAAAFNSTFTWTTTASGTFDGVVASFKP